MKSEDKFGRRIYSKTFLILQKYGEMLADLGWKESQKKPNLFYKMLDGITVFADMRGTEIVPIWEDPCPLMYVTMEHEDWKRRRAVRYAAAELGSAGIPHRLSFYDEAEPDGLLFGDPEELPDGKCKLCGNEFDHDGLFCSETCEKTSSQLNSLRDKVRAHAGEQKCAVCGKTLKWYGKDYVLHHVDYRENKTIPVCRSCHPRIHSHQKDYPDLAPSKPKTSTCERNKAPTCAVIDGTIACTKCKAKFVSLSDFENHWKANHIRGRRSS
jgi:predicted HNH restriction endonuclease